MAKDRMRWLQLSTEIPTFEDWFQTVSTFETNDEAWDVDARYVCLPPIIIATYLRQLLLEAGSLCKDLSSTRLSCLIWFFNGICSGYWHEVRSAKVPRIEQAQTVRALGNFYRDYLDPFLRKEDTRDSDAETAVYMMWDMDCLEGAAMFPGEEHLVDPIFEVLGIALRCKSYGCQKSALHGLGHLQSYHPKRVQAAIDWALSQRGHLHPDLIDYAYQARTGMVQ